MGRIHRSRRLALPVALATVLAVQCGTMAAPGPATQFEDDVRRYMETGRDYEAEMAEWVRQRVARRKKAVERGCKRLRSDADRVDAQRRLSAIGAFEAFIRKYPDEPFYTPDAMFRLAELYYERASLQAPEDADVEQIAPLFDDCVRIYRELLERFPHYRYADAAWYMLAYVLEEEQGEPDEADVAWKALVERFPKSPYATRAWMYLAENAFDGEDYTTAAQYYRRVLEFGPESGHYDAALYKLGWTYFELFDYDHAIRTFLQLIAWYDEQKAKGKLVATNLRDEAIEYLALSLAEDDWDGDHIPDPNAGMERALAYLKTGAPYEREILERYAQALYEQHEHDKYLESAKVLSYLIEREPDHPDNPLLQQRIVDLFNTMGDAARAEAALRTLVRSYAPGTPWYRHNAKHPQALARADSIIEDALIQEADIAHKRAQNLQRIARQSGNPEDVAAAVKAYARAARAYAAYLERYPDSPQAYDIHFFYAEALYYSGQFTKAAREYAWVRDFEGGGQYRDAAAFSVVKAFERAIESAVTHGDLPPAARPAYEHPGELIAEVSKENPAVADGKAAGAASKAASKVRRVRALSLPPLVEAWIAAADRYVDMGAQGSTDPLEPPKLRYQAGALLYRYLHFPEARKHFEDVIDRFGHTEIAAYAASLLIDSFRKENDYDNLEKWAKLLEQKGIGRPEERAKLQREIHRFRLGARFHRAEALLEQKRYVDAAREFIRVIDEDTRHELPFADKALYNAAVAYEQAHHYDSAARVLERIVTEKRFTNSDIYDEALFRLAENHKRFFDFERAAERYLQFAQRKPTAPDAPYALYEAAQLLENDGQLQRAAKILEEYVRRYPSRPDAPAILFHTAELYLRMHQPAEARKRLSDLIHRWYRLPAASEQVVHAWLMLADMAWKAGSKKTAVKYYENVIREYNTRGFEPGSEPANWAAKAQFMLAERVREKYVAINLPATTSKRQMRIVQHKLELRDRLSKAYTEVAKYRSPLWAAAALYRIGEIEENIADMLLNAEPPTDLSEDGAEIFQEKLADAATQEQNKATMFYEKAVLHARKRKVDNEWTRKALAALNKFKPEEYPVLQPARVQWLFVEPIVPVTHVGTEPPSGKATTEGGTTAGAPAAADGQDDAKATSGADRPASPSEPTPPTAQGSPAGPTPTTTPEGAP